MDSGLSKFGVLPGGGVAAGTMVLPAALMAMMASRLAFGRRKELPLELVNKLRVL